MVEEKYAWPSPTVFVDLDGCLVRHAPPAEHYAPLVPLPGARALLDLWWRQNIRVIIVTGRPTANYDWLQSEFIRLHLYYTQFVMDAGAGRRYLVNDMKPYEPERPTAIAINVPRNAGLTTEDLKYLR